MLSSYIEIQTTEFDLGARWRDLQGRLGTKVGAIAGFVGLVREAAKSTAGGGRDDTQVQALTLEHYPGMTERSIADIVDTAAERFPLLGVEVIHRVGRLLPSEQIVMVLVGAEHRTAAFDACQYIMDYLKTDAVLWKREEYDQDSRWLSAAESDRVRRAHWRD